IWVPQTIHSDRGPQFTGSLWGHLGQLLGVKNLFTTSYHPESNGIIERFHRTLKTSLAARISQEGESWVKALPFVLLGLRSSTPCIPGSEFSPLHLLLGEAPRLPLTLVNEGERLPDKKLFERLQDLKHSPPRVIPETSSRFLSAVDKLKKAEFVFVKNIPIRPSLSPTYLGPFKVLKKFDRVFELDFGQRTDHVSIDRLKPAFGIRDILPSFG
ncbi:Putative LOC100708214, partial [Caligus rogercresseyi]